MEKLEDLDFTGVPQNQQDCIKYDAQEKCTQWSVPTLAGENISSMIINGDYLVLLVYFGPSDASNGPWTSCEEFPTGNDVNKIGPQQMKWENIRNNNGNIPNYLIIIPTVP